MRRYSYMIKHTPGPWKVDGYGAVLGPKVGPTGEYRPADARLIAAAPEMLEFLKTIERSDCIGDDAQRRLRSLIAKAEGRDAG